MDGVVYIKSHEIFLDNKTVNKATSVLSLSYILVSNTWHTNTHTDMTHPCTQLNYHFDKKSGEWQVFFKNYPGDDYLYTDLIVTVLKSANLQS